MIGTKEIATNEHELNIKRLNTAYKADKNICDYICLFGHTEQGGQVLNEALKIIRRNHDILEGKIRKRAIRQGRKDITDNLEKTATRLIYDNGLIMNDRIFIYLIDKAEKLGK